MIKPYTKIREGKQVIKPSGSLSLSQHVITVCTLTESVAMCSLIGGPEEVTLCAGHEALTVSNKQPGFEYSDANTDACLQV